MKKIFSWVSNKLFPYKEDHFEEYSFEEKKQEKEKIKIKPFTLNKFEDIKEIINVLREGYTVALIDVKNLRNQDLAELKRAINSIKKTCDAINGDIAGLSEDMVIATPGFIKISKVAK